MNQRVEKKGGLLVISGPSGSGKTTICRQLGNYPEVQVSVSATTRPRRPGEVHGKDYYFLTHDEFMDRINKNDFVEYNEVFKNNVFYGSLKSEMEEALSKKDQYYLMEIDVQGGLNLKEQNYKGIYIFVAPPSMEELRRRLMYRGTENNKNVENRLVKAEWEMEQAGQYDFTVVNDDLDKAITQIVDILRLGADD